MSIIFKILKYLKKHSNLIKNIITAVCLIAALIGVIFAINYKSLYNEQTEAASIAVEEKNAAVADKEKLNQQIQEYENQIAEKDKTIDELEEKVEEVKRKKSAASITNLSNTYTISPSTDADYSQATYIWNYLKGLGLNDYVCAGIMGNIMAEVGGQTLDISRWSTYAGNSYYYGICQWAGSRKSRLLNDFGTSLEAQVKFLGVELFEVIPSDNSFYNMQNEKEAALYFAKYYERCNSKHYSVRQQNATAALQYFTAQ